MAENLEIYLQEKMKEKEDKKKVDFCLVLKSKEKVALIKVVSITQLKNYVISFTHSVIRTCD